MVYLVVAVIFLHIVSLPLVLKVKIYVDTDNNVGNVRVKLFFVTVFSKAIDIDLIKHRLFDGQYNIEQSNSKESGKKSSAFKAFIMDCALSVARRIRVRDMCVDGKIGSGDAAADAILAGMANVAYGNVCAFFCHDFDGSFTPVYGNELLFFDFFGIFSLCFADIIVAVCGVLLNRLSHIGKRRSYANVTD